MSADHFTLLKMIFRNIPKEMVSAVFQNGQTENNRAYAIVTLVMPAGGTRD